jgi:hypothetical protein
MQLRNWFAGLVFCSTLIGSAVAHAGGSVSAAGFIPYQPSDAPYIYHGAFDVYNNDSVNTHYAVASLGYAPNTALSWQINVNNNGGLQQCTAWAFNPVTGASYTSTGSTTAVGITSYGLIISAPNASYFVNLFCYMPPTNVNGTSQVYGAH